MEYLNQSHSKTSAQLKKILEDERLKELLSNITIQESPVNGWVRLGNVHFPPNGGFANMFYKHLRDYVLSKFNTSLMKTVNVINLSSNFLPQYETKGAAGMDIRADFSRVTIENPLKFYAGSGYFDFEKKMLRIDSMARVLIPTGLKVGLPDGMEMQIRPRSGMALKKGLTVINAPGTVDEDYRGEVGVPVINLSTEPVWIEHAERICQAVFNDIEKIIWNLVDTLDETERGEGGFNSTGSK